MSRLGSTEIQRTQAARDNDLGEISALAILGHSISEIVKRLNKDKNRVVPANYDTVRNDLKIIRSQWQTENLQTIAEHKAVEMEKLNNLEYTYWKHYKRTDDIKALHGVAHCIQQRSQITGLQNAQIAQNNVQVVFAWGGDKAQIPQNEASGQTIAGTFARVEEQTSSG